MNKKQAVLIIILCVVFSWAFNLFFGRSLAAKLSTWPVLNRWHILNPDTPIVITNRETVRVSDSGDAIAAAGDIKSKISTLVWVGSSIHQLAGYALNLTSDGSFVAASQSFTAQNSGSFYVLLSDGRSAKVISETADPATALTFFKADLGGVPVANIGDSKSLEVGEKLVFAGNSTQNYIDKAVLAFVGTQEADVSGALLQSDFPLGSLSVHADSALFSGQILVDTGANVMGVYNGSAVVPSDVLRQAMDLYFSNNAKITRPSLGFSYGVITANESALSGMPQGALVKEVSAGSAAKLGGLIAGDIITGIGGKAVSESSLPENILQSSHLGDKLEVTVTRGKQIVNLTLTVVELK